MPEPPVDVDRMVYPRGSLEFGRVLAFTDGVVAIALTLLVLNLEVPRPAGDDAGVDIWQLVSGLGDQFFAFGLSFAIIGFYWIAHHRFAAQLRAVDLPMLVWTLLFLVVIVLIPFQSDLIGLYGDNPQAVALYAGGFAVIGVVDAAGLLIARARDLLSVRPGPAELRFVLAMRLVPGAVFLASVPIALVVSVGLAQWSWALIWPLTVLVGRLLDPSRA